MRAITELGYEKPSPIQAEALPLLLGDRTDFLGLAATGTGKTAAFAIPLLERIDPSIRAVQALILCPTRELANQVAGQIDLLGKYKGIRALPIYGGAPYGDQIAGLRRGVSVVVGTPGRLVDHIDRGTLSLAYLDVMILDEADEMISMGFKDDLEKILQAAAERAEEGQSNNIWLFSATMSSEVRKVADEYLREPEMVQINRKEMLSGTVEQLYYATQESNKPEVLCKLIESAEDFYGLVFCQTKSLVTDLTRYLAERSYKVDCLHGDMDQKARERTMQAFRDRKVQLLICTDVASRGLDVKDITHVINYSIPRELDNYVHRIGRTGRSGKTGIAMSLVTPSHRVLIGRIEKMTKSKIKEGKIPTRKEIAAKKIGHVLGRFTELKAFDRAVELMGDSWKEVLSEMSSDEVAARFLIISFPDLFADRAREMDRDSEQRDYRGGSGRDSDRGGHGRAREYGRNDRGSPRDRGGYQANGPKSDLKIVMPGQNLSSKPSFPKVVSPSAPKTGVLKVESVAIVKAPQVKSAPAGAQAPAVKPSPWDQYKNADKKAGKKDHKKNIKKRAWDKPLSR